MTFGPERLLGVLEHAELEALAHRAVDARAELAVARRAQAQEEHAALAEHAAARGDEVHEAAHGRGRAGQLALDVVLPVAEKLVAARVLEDDAEGLGPVLVPVVDGPEGPLGLDARAELDAAHELARDRLSRRPARHNRARAPRTRHPGLLSAAGHPRARCSQRKSARALRARAAQGAGHVTLPSSTAKDHATGILPSPGSWRRSQQFWGV